MVLATISPDVVRAIVRLAPLTGAIKWAGAVEANVAQVVIIHARENAPVAGALAASAEINNDA